MAFYQYIGTVTRVYDAFDITAQPTGPIYDFGSNQPPADGNWASHAGPATAVPDNQQVQFPPGVPPVSQTLSVLAWATATFYKAGMGVISPTTGMLSICQTPHTAGTYATDLAAGKWSETMTTAGGNAAYAPIVGSGNYAPSKVLRKRDLPKSPFIPALNSDVPSTWTYGPGGNSPIAYESSSNTLLPYNTTQVTMLGCLPVTVQDAGSNNATQNQCNGATGSGATPWAVEFDYYGQNFDLKFRTAFTAGAWFWLWADGQPTTATPIQATPANVGANSYSFQQWAWGARKKRRLKLYMAGCDFEGLDISAGDSVTPTRKPAVSMALIGDSWSVGTGANNALQAAAITLGIILGVEMYVCGFGGTGYTANDGGAFKVYGDPVRMTPLATIQPTYVGFQGSSNDNGSTASAVGTAAAAAFTAALTQSPNSKLMVVSVQALGSSPAAQAVLNDAAVVSAAEAAGAVMVASPIQETWITGSGQNSGTPVTPPVLTLGTISGSGGTFVAGTYYAVVTARTAAGDTAASNEVSFTVAANGTVALSWSQPTGHTGYKVWIGTTPGGEKTIIGALGGFGVTLTTAVGTQFGTPANPGVSTGSVGDGNADFYANGLVAGHPTQDGTDYFATKIREDIVLSLAP